MNETARAAFIIAQAALLNARVASMQAENQHRADRGLAQAYGEEHFADVEMEFACLQHNECLTYLRG